MQKSIQNGLSKGARLLVAVCLPGMLSVAQATLLDSEGFDYSAGDIVGQNGGAGWTAAWANPASGGTAPWGTGGTMGNRKGDALATVPGLNYPGLDTSGGALNAGALSAYRSWDSSSLFASTGNSFWISFLVDPISGGAASSAYALPFAENSPTVAPDYQKGSGAKFSTGSTAWSVTLDIPGLENGSGYTTPPSLSLMMDQANLIVMEFNYNGSGADSIQLWVNPTLGGSTPQLSDPTTTTGNGWLDPLGEFMIKSGSGVTASFDEIRIGNSFSDVTPSSVPEPGSAMLLCAGVAAAAWMSRRRSSKPE
jgi:PEP-CTERM motif